MSWSVGAIGKAPAVAVKLKADLDAMTCSEPENSVKDGAGVALIAALAAQSPTAVVKASASGSQSQTYDKDGTTVLLVNNTLSISVEPVWGFVE